MERGIWWEGEDSVREANGEVSFKGFQWRRKNGTHERLE